MTQHRFINDGFSPIPMGATAEYACVCGRRGSRAAIERHIAENSTDEAAIARHIAEDAIGDDEGSTPVDYAAIVVSSPPTDEVDGDFGGGNTKAHYLPIEPRRPAPPSQPPPVARLPCRDAGCVAPLNRYGGCLVHDPRFTTPPPLPSPPSAPTPQPALILLSGDACPICQTGAKIAELPEIAAWSCGHWIRRKPQPIAESFQDMLRTAFQAGIAAAASGETYEIWYQREVLQ